MRQISDWLQFDKHCACQPLSQWAITLNVCDQSFWANIKINISQLLREKNSWCKNDKAKQFSLIILENSFSFGDKNLHRIKSPLEIKTWQSYIQRKTETLLLGV